MARALDEGLAVLVVSTDFEEIAQICHRAIIWIGAGGLPNSRATP